MRSKFCYIVFAILGTILVIDAIKQDYYWRDYISNDIPCDAFEAAPGRYIGITDYYGNAPLGIYPYSKVGVLVGAGKITIRRHIKIMCTSNQSKFYWDLVNFNKSSNILQMENAVLGGYRNDLSIELYIGKTYHEDEWKIGKVVPIDHHQKGLWVWNQSNEVIKIYEFYLLKYNSTDPSCPCIVEAN